MKKRKKEKNRIRLFIILALIVGVIFGIFIGILIKTGIKIGKESNGEEFVDITKLPQLETKNFLEANISVSLSAIHVFADCKQIDMLTTEEQTESIQRGMEKRLSERPNVHDIIVSIFEILNIKVLQTKIESMQEQTYYAKLFLQKGNKILALDSKPSDAIAIASRMNAKIYINKTLLGEHGIKVC